MRHFLGKNRCQEIFKTLSIAFLFVVAFSAAAPQRSLAAESSFGFPAGGLGSTVEAKVSPEFPGPNTQAAVNLFGSADLDRSKISWFQDGSLKASGVGLKQFQFSTGPLGNGTGISVTIESGAGEVTKKLFVRAANVDLLWESDGYTPPFYRGRSHAAPGSHILFAAIPHLASSQGGSEIAGANVLYRWSKDGTVLGSFSGVGKNTLRLTAPNTGTMTVRVEASAQNGTLIAASQTIIAASDPQILLYKSDPALGIRFDRSLPNTFTLAKEEERVVAIPFAFSSESREDESLSYRWTVNGASLSTNQSGRGTIVLNRAGASGGAASIRLVVEHAVAFMQGAERTVTAQTGEQNSPFTQTAQ